MLENAKTIVNTKPTPLTEVLATLFDQQRLLREAILELQGKLAPVSCPVQEGINKVCQNAVEEKTPRSQVVTELERLACFLTQDTFTIHSLNNNLEV